jgi:hypothetical protein
LKTLKSYSEDGLELLCWNTLFLPFEKMPRWMRETDTSLDIKEDRGIARNQTSLERRPDPAWVRGVLPRGTIHSKLNPYVLCSILSQRTRQLATHYPGKRFSQVIQISKSELREGRLQWVVPQFSPQRTGSATQSERATDPDRRKAELSRL